jgi:hypothetical protein
MNACHQNESFDPVNGTYLETFDIVLCLFDWVFFPWKGIEIYMPVIIHFSQPRDKFQRHHGIDSAKGQSILRPQFHMGIVQLQRKEIKYVCCHDACATIQFTHTMYDTTQKLY